MSDEQQLVGDELGDQFNVLLHPPDSREPIWLANLVDAAGGVTLWWARGHDQTEALTNLCLVMAEELGDRAHFLPDDYVMRQDRVKPDAESAVPAYTGVDFENRWSSQLPGWRPPADAKCKTCGCTDADCSQCIARTGRACTWAAEDLCSACVEPHAFDPHPLRPLSCAVCSATFIPGDPVCQGTPGYLTNEMIEAGGSDA